MTAPTITQRYEADTTDFRSGVQLVEKDLKSTGEQLKKFGRTAANDATKPVNKFTDSLKKSQKAVTSYGKKIGTVAGSMLKWASAATAAATAIGGALYASQLKSIKELKTFATLSGLTVAELQQGAYAANAQGIELDKYADILKDVNDRLGDFAATGAGAMADFFENIAPRVGVTAEAFKGLNSEQALGLYIKSLEDANLSQAEMTFYMEAIASDSTALIPLFTKNAEKMRAMKEQAAALGIGLSNIDVESALAAQRQLAQIAAIIDNEIKVAVAELSPLVATAAADFIKWFQGSGDKAENLTDRVLAFGRGLIEFVNDSAKFFNGLGASFDFVAGTARTIAAGIKGLAGSAVGTIADMVIQPTRAIVETMQFVVNAFPQFVEDIKNSLKSLGLFILDKIVAPVEGIISLLASLPSEVGGDMFKGALDSIGQFRQELQDTRADLNDPTKIKPVETGEAMAAFNSFADSITGALTTAYENTSEVSQSLTNSAAESIKAATQNFVDMQAALGEPISTEAMDEYFTAFETRLGQMREKIREQAGMEPDNTGVDGGSVTAGGEQAEGGNALQNFLSETAMLIEAQHGRYASQNELALLQHQKEIEMLKERFDSGLMEEEEYNRKVNEIRQKSADTHKQLLKQQLADQLNLMMQGNGKTAKVLRKFAIVGAIVKGKQAAVDAWQAGMSTGGPWAPAVAAAYTAASIARTGSMIASLRSGGSSSGGGGAAAPAIPQTPQQSGGNNGQIGGQSPQRVFNISLTGQTQSTESVRQLIGMINEEAGNNVTITTG